MNRHNQLEWSKLLFIVSRHSGSIIVNCEREVCKEIFQFCFKDAEDVRKFRTLEQMIKYTAEFRKQKVVSSLSTLDEQGQ